MNAMMTLTGKRKINGGLKILLTGLKVALMLLQLLIPVTTDV